MRDTVARCTPERAITYSLAEMSASRISSRVDGNVYGAGAGFAPAGLAGLEAVRTALVNISSNACGLMGLTVPWSYTEFNSAAPKVVASADTTACRFAPSVEGPTPRSSSRPMMSRCTTSAITSSRREATMISMALPRSGTASFLLACSKSWLILATCSVLLARTASTSGTRISDSMGQKLFSHASTTSSDRSSHRA